MKPDGNKRGNDSEIPEKKAGAKTQTPIARLINENDWKGLKEIWEDFNRSAYAKYDVPHAHTDAEIRAKAKRWAEASRGKEHMFFAICFDEKMIGYVDFHKIADGYECGYCFHSDYHGKGYAKESLNALFYRVADGQKTRFVVGTALHNLSSVRLLRSLGFEKTGEEKKSFYKDEKGDDIYFDGGIFALDVN